jgi:uncharacterized membrane protein
MSSPAASLSQRAEMLKKLGKIIISGFFILLPLMITVWVLTVLFDFADGILRGPVQAMTGYSIPGIGIIAIFIISFLLGLISNYILGKELIHLSEEIINKLPIVNTLYASVKKMNEVLFLQKGKEVQRRVCAVEYPRKGIYSIGFATGDGPSELKKRKRSRFTNVFIPNTPAPATGFTIVVPTKDVMFLDMSIEDALRIIVSGGTISK